MDMTMRILTPDERKYTYTQSSQLISQTGCIGHLRADMDTDGNDFFSSWDNHRGDLKTDEFKAEFDEVINALRFSEDYGPILKNRSALASYCYSHPEGSYGGDNREFGVRVDTAQYAYLLRLNPNRGEYNLYCYCYRRDWLDRHRKNAEKGIRFITPDYKEKFRIPDGGKIHICRYDGIHLERRCRFIDEYHFELGGSHDVYHICQFAEINARNGNTVTSPRGPLPKHCFAVLPSTKEVVSIERYKHGYAPRPNARRPGETARQAVNLINSANHVTRAEEAAMLAGCTIGWDTPAADPKNYNQRGQHKGAMRKERGDAR